MVINKNGKNSYRIIFIKQNQSKYLNEIFIMKLSKEKLKFVKN